MFDFYLVSKMEISDGVKSTPKCSTLLSVEKNSLFQYTS